MGITTYRINGKTCVLIVPKGALGVDFRWKEYVEKIAIIEVVKKGSK